MPGGTAFVPPPTAISNRTFIERMKAWGWEQATVNNDRTLMIGRNEAVWVKSAHHHHANSARTFREVLAIMGLTWEEFMTSDLHAKAEQMVDEEIAWGLDFAKRLSDAINQAERKHVRREAERAQKRLQIEAAEKKAREAMEAAEAVLTAQDLPDAQTDQGDPEGPQKAPQKRVGGAQEVIFDVLIQNRVPMSINALMAATGFDRNRATGACGHLAKSGHITRVKKGIYQVADKWTSGRSVIDVHHQSDAAQVSQDDKGGLHVTTRADAKPVLPGPQVTEVRSWDADQAEVITEVLDLLFPNGFKAKHLPLIDTWRQATAAMMQAVLEDQG